MSFAKFRVPYVRRSEVSSAFEGTLPRRGASCRERDPVAVHVPRGTTFLSLDVVPPRRPETSCKRPGVVRRSRAATAAGGAGSDEPPTRKVQRTICERRRNGYWFYRSAARGLFLSLAHTHARAITCTGDFVHIESCSRRWRKVFRRRGLRPGGQLPRKVEKVRGSAVARRRVRQRRCPAVVQGFGFSFKVVEFGRSVNGVCQVIGYVPCWRWRAGNARRDVSTGKYLTESIAVFQLFSSTRGVNGRFPLGSASRRKFHQTAKVRERRDAPSPSGHLLNKDRRNEFVCCCVGCVLPPPSSRRSSSRRVTSFQVILTSGNSLKLCLENFFLFTWNVILFLLSRRIYYVSTATCISAVIPWVFVSF